jgi:hypothetical protein
MDDLFPSLFIGYLLLRSPARATLTALEDDLEWNPGIPRLQRLFWTGVGWQTE